MTARRSWRRRPTNVSHGDETTDAEAGVTDDDLRRRSSRLEPRAPAGSATARSHRGRRSRRCSRSCRPTPSPTATATAVCVAELEARDRHGAGQAGGDVPAERDDGPADRAAHLGRPQQLPHGRLPPHVARRAARGARLRAPARPDRAAGRRRPSSADDAPTSRTSTNRSRRCCSSCRSARSAGRCPSGTSWPRRPRGRASGASPCTSTGPGSGSPRPTTAVRRARWPRSSTPSTSRSTRGSAASPARAWPARPTSSPRRRCGGAGTAARSSAMWPYAAAALHGLRTRLPRMPAYLQQDARDRRRDPRPARCRGRRRPAADADAARAPAHRPRRRAARRARAGDRARVGGAVPQRAVGVAALARHRAVRGGDDDGLAPRRRPGRDRPARLVRGSGSGPRLDSARVRADLAQHPVRRLQRPRGRARRVERRGRLGARRRHGQPLRAEPDDRAPGRGAAGRGQRPAAGLPPDDRATSTAGPRLCRGRRRAASRSTSRPSTAPAALARDLRRLGARAGMALKPATPIDDYADLLPELDMLLLMTVEPGFGGQQFLDHVLPKIRRARELVERRPAWTSGCRSTAESRPRPSSGAPTRAPTSSSPAPRSTGADDPAAAVQAAARPKPWPPLPTPGGPWQTDPRHSNVRAPGSVQFRTGGDSPRPVHRQR